MSLLPVDLLNAYLVDVNAAGWSVPPSLFVFLLLPVEGAVPGLACAPLLEQLLVLKGRGSHKWYLLLLKCSPNSSEQEIEMQLFSEHCELM